MAKRKPAKLKKFNVFYTPISTEHELIIEARSLKEAVEKVEALMKEQVEMVRGGWEIKGCLPHS